MKKTVCIIVFIFLAINLMSQQTQKQKIKAALLVIDVQNAYFPFMDQSDTEKPVRLINAYIRYFNELKLPVIYIYHQDKKTGPAEDSKEFQFIDQIKVPGDANRITKQYGNAFTKTDLDKLLKKLDCNTLFLCGLSSTGCVMATTVGAYDHDYDVYWVKDATMGPDKEKTKMMESVFHTTDLMEIKEIIE